MLIDPAMLRAGGRNGGWGHFPLEPGLLGELLAEEVVQERADDRSQPELDQRLGRGTHRGRDYIGAELELQGDGQP